MGNSESFQVVLCLHAVNNIQHADNESYYGMVSGSMDKHDSAGVSVTSDRLAQLAVGVHTVLTLRVFLHKQGAHSSTDREIGHLAIPLELCGQGYGGIYQTWFILEQSGPGHTDILRQHAEFIDAFLSDATIQKMQQPRVCLTILKAQDHKTWLEDEAKWQDYHDMVLRSHQQLREMCAGYCRCIDALEAGGGDFRLPGIGENDAREPPLGAVRPDELRDRLVGVLRERQQLEEVNADEKISKLQLEMDEVLVQANEQLEGNNKKIQALKADRKRLQDEFAAQGLEKTQANQRYIMQKQRNQDLKAEDNRETPACVTEEAYQDELKKYRVLQKKKEWLSGQVQKAYGNQPND